MLSPCCRAVNDQMRLVDSGSRSTRSDLYLTIGADELFKKQLGGSVLSFVGLLIASANQVLDSLRGFFTLALFELGHPIRDCIYNVTGRLASGFGLASFAVNAFSAFDNLYFFL